MSGIVSVDTLHVFMSEVRAEFDGLRSEVLDLKRQFRALQAQGVGSSAGIGFSRNFNAGGFSTQNEDGNTYRGAGRYISNADLAELRKELVTMSIQFKLGDAEAEVRDHVHSLIPVHRRKVSQEVERLLTSQKRRDEILEELHRATQSTGDTVSRSTPRGNNHEEIDMDEEGSVTSTRAALLPRTGKQATPGEKAYAEIQSNAQVESDLQCNVWSAGILAIVKDVPDCLMRGKKIESSTRVKWVALTLFINLYLQFIFLYWIWRNSVLPEVRSLQIQYKEFHRVAYHQGQFSSQGFDSMGEGRRGICEMALSTNLFVIACLFLWASRCLNEMRIVYRRWRSISSLPRLPPDLTTTHMAHEVRLQEGEYFKEDKIMIICLNRSSRLLLNVVILGPSFLIAVLMLLLGTAFLTATASFTDLILNSVALSFVFDIDELLMSCFLPARLKHKLEVTKIMCPLDVSRQGMSAQDAEDTEIKEAYAHSLVILLAVIAWLWVWLAWNPVLPGYEWDVGKHCAGFLSADRTIPCPWWNVWNNQCFSKN